MACNICGSTRHEAITAGCPDPYERFNCKTTGWACPVCNKGNAPDAKTCGHCARREQLSAFTLVSGVYYSASGKDDIYVSDDGLRWRRTEDMKPYDGD